MTEEQKVIVLIELFNTTFSEFNTRLVLGDAEPIYLPKTKEVPFHQVVFAHGYFSSALHEVAHWCIAGEKRRQQIDYGYWYQPDGRNAVQQAEFEQVEVKPQAIEWAFALASKHSFSISVDNLSGESTESTAFSHAVTQQLMHYLQAGFPARAQQFIDALTLRFKSAMPTQLSKEQLHAYG